MIGPDFFEFDAESWLTIDVDEATPEVRRVANFTDYSILTEQHAYAHQDRSFVDVAEVMGGEGRTTQVLVRRGYSSGDNFDCVVGCDLMRADEEQRLYDYIGRFKPKVLVMAPQCTGMAGWGRFNAVMNPEAHQRSAAISHHLGTICARCAILQYEGGRHYFLEQPKGFDLYKMPIYQYLAYVTRMIWCYMHMCSWTSID